MYLSTVSSRLFLYDTNSWDLKKCYGCCNGLMRDISWSDDGKYMLQVNSKGLVEILTAVDHDVRSLQHIPIKDTWSASFHRDGHRNIAIGSKSGSVLIWDTKNKTIAKTFPTPSHQCNVNFVSYNSKNTTLAATMQNGDTIIYGLVSNIPVLTVKLSCSKSISAMKFHHESRSLLGLASDEGHVVLRDITTNKDKFLFENVHASPVSDLGFSLINKDVMFSSGYDKVMHVYDIRSQNVVSTVRTSYYLTSLSMNTQNQVALGTRNGVVLIYDLRDLSNPQKILMGHEEVRKVAYQPLRKKISNDASLREDLDPNLSPIKISSPIRNRASDAFIVTNTPPKVNRDVFSEDVKADSFLAIIGFDKTNDLENEGNNTMENEKRNFRADLRYNSLGTENNITVKKASTPIIRLQTSEEDILTSSPILVENGMPDDGQGSNLNTIMSNQNPQKIPNALDGKTIAELKDFMKLTLADVTDENKSYFFDVLMMLTKQKLYLEKQMSGMNEQIHNLIQNQNTLIDINRKLSLDIEQLKHSIHSVINEKVQNM